MVEDKAGGTAAATADVGSAEGTSGRSDVLLHPQGKGRNIVWNIREMMALVQAATAASTDPGVCSGLREHALCRGPGVNWIVLTGTRFKACYDRLIAMKLTRNPGDNGLFHCADLLYSDGSKSLSHIYDCIRSPNYHIAKSFKIRETFTFLNGHTTVLQASGVEQAEKRRDVKPQGPIGTKAAKVKREMERKGRALTGEVGVAQTINRIEH
ncbi:hypothetical protein FGB62_49g217 [Gracilaria domingensis]|nr:hypothetical protein FGB62_49g217 [Gracilaria domingensis]